MLSVIIPCYNAADTIGVQLAALASQTCGGPWEVIVADNAKPRVELIKNAFPLSRPYLY